MVSWWKIVLNGSNSYKNVEKAYNFRIESKTGNGLL